MHRSGEKARSYRESRPLLTRPFAFPSSAGSPYRFEQIQCLVGAGYDRRRGSQGPLRAQFQREEFTYAYYDGLTKLIEAKAKGQKIPVAPRGNVASVVDKMAALGHSLIKTSPRINPGENGVASRTELEKQKRQKSWVNEANALTFLVCFDCTVGAPHVRRNQFFETLELAPHARGAAPRREAVSILVSRKRNRHEGVLRARFPQILAGVAGANPRAQIEHQGFQLKVFRQLQRFVEAAPPPESSFRWSFRKNRLNGQGTTSESPATTIRIGINHRDDEVQIFQSPRDFRISRKSVRNRAKCAKVKYRKDRPQAEGAATT